jgi:hypothetical protein
MADAAPDPERCKKAIKILEQFERLARKFGVKIPIKRLDRLKQLRDAGTIQISDLPGTLAREFPAEFAGQTLAQIRAKCGLG